MLAMDLQHRVHRGGQLPDGEGRAIEQDPAPTVGGKLALHDQLEDFLIAVDLHADGLEGWRRGERKVKDRLGRHLLRAGADHFRGTAGTPQELQRVDEQGLSCAGLSGQDIQRRTRFNDELLDDGEISDFEVGDHRGKSLTEVEECVPCGAAVPGRLFVS